MKHLRILTTVEAHSLDHPLTFIFTRAFLADNFKGLRTKCPNDTGTVQTAATIAEAVAPAITTPSQEPDSVSVHPPSSVGRPSIHPKKYFSLVSPILRTLRGEGSSGESDSSSESDSELEEQTATCVSKCPNSSVLPQTVTGIPNKEEDTAQDPVVQTIVGKSGDDVSDLYEQLRRLGLPTSFGSTKNMDFVYRDYESNEQWVDTSDQVLLQCAENYFRFGDFRQKPRFHRSRSASTSKVDLIEQNHDQVYSLSRCTSSDDLLAYHRSVFENLCYLLELACSFEQRGCSDLNLRNLSLPKAWRSPDFNLEAFLYSCKKYWRYEAPVPRSPSTKDSKTLPKNTSLPDLINLESDPVLAKYWAQRFRLFSRFNHGIQTDRDGFFSATPEAIACHQALRVKRSLARGESPVQTLTVIDACSGTGANSIQFALLGFRVIAIEVDPSRVAMASHNAEIYGVRSQIQFVCADFFQWAREELLRHSDCQAPPYSALFMSPPWGGPAYLDCQVFDLNCIHFDSAGVRTFWFAIQLASQLTGGNLILFLPRNTNMAQLPRVSECVRSACLWSPVSPCLLEVEANVLNTKFKSLTVYSGALCTRIGLSNRLRQPQRAHIPPLPPSYADETDEEDFDSVHSDFDDPYWSSDRGWSDENDDDDDECSSCGYVTASDS